MPIYATADLPQVEISRAAFNRQGGGVAAVAPNIEFGTSKFDVLRRELNAIESSESYYKLRTPVSARLIPEFKEGGYKLASTAFPSIVGEGKTPKQAYDFFQEEVHRSIQDLLAKRPFEMNEDEAELWKSIEDRVDIADYVRRTPLKIRQIGVVTSDRQGARTVRWEGFIGKESITLSQFPDEFARYRVNQQFEAISLRDRRTMKLIKAVYVAKHTTPPPSEEKKREIREAMPDSSALPTRKWG